jgi:hypothetical protein
MAKKSKIVTIDPAVRDARIKEHLDRQANTAMIVYRFNNLYNHSLVYLHSSGEDRTAFQIHFRIQDEFIDGGIYARGNAVIYPNKAVYEAIQDIAWSVVPSTQKLHWNNTGTIGWLPYSEDK